MRSFNHDRKMLINLHEKHWLIEHFQVREQIAIRNHIFASICSYVRLQYLRVTDFIDNYYSLQRNLFNKVISAFILNFMHSINNLDS